MFGRPPPGRLEPRRQARVLWRSYAAANQAGALTQARDLIKTQVRTGEVLGHEGVGRVT